MNINTISQALGSLDLRLDSLLEVLRAGNGIDEKMRSEEANRVCYDLGGLRWTITELQNAPPQILPPGMLEFLVQLSMALSEIPEVLRTGIKMDSFACRIIERDLRMEARKLEPLKKRLTMFIRNLRLRSAG